MPTSGKKLEKTKCEFAHGKGFPFFVSPKDLPLKFSVSDLGRNIRNTKMDILRTWNSWMIVCLTKQPPVGQKTQTVYMLDFGASS